MCVFRQKSFLFYDIYACLLIIIHTSFIHAHTHICTHAYMYKFMNASLNTSEKLCSQFDVYSFCILILRESRNFPLFLLLYFTSLNRRITTVIIDLESY